MPRQPIGEKATTNAERQPRWREWRRITKQVAASKDATGCNETVDPIDAALDEMAVTGKSSAEVARELGVDPYYVRRRMSNRWLAAELGVSEATVRRARRREEG
jgi:hypothetical protein